ncbi:MULTISPECIES: hypothetical protein [Streptomyces]|uniref:hypothetical protein n=1 Tax=Streptomyces TaxID=1883 RepID=UPI001F2B6180|nr:MULTISPECIES: hypothetical protein [Streptomyces]
MNIGDVPAFPGEQPFVLGPCPSLHNNTSFVWVRELTGATALSGSESGAGCSGRRCVAFRGNATPVEFDCMDTNLDLA